MLELGKWDNVFYPFQRESGVWFDIIPDLCDRYVEYECECEQM